mmetsp:Transcript_38939/g.103502  ORF Transcript_38939/g.103502 Transcript_38939/m.103502 type:complete len:255 (+) Transcript_38939:813-1577(+)
MTWSDQTHRIPSFHLEVHTVEDRNVLHGGIAKPHSFELYVSDVVPLEFLAARVQSIDQRPTIQQLEHRPASIGCESGVAHKEERVGDAAQAECDAKEHCHHLLSCATLQVRNLAAHPKANKERHKNGPLAETVDQGTQANPPPVAPVRKRLLLNNAGNVALSPDGPDNSDVAESVTQRCLHGLRVFAAALSNNVRHAIHQSSRNHQYWHGDNKAHSHWPADRHRNVNGEHEATHSLELHPEIAKNVPNTVRLDL